MNFQEDYDALREHAIFGIFDIDKFKEEWIKEINQSSRFLFFLEP